MTFTITVEEANLILEALGNLPFVKVYALIGKLQEQARRQLGNASEPDTSPQAQSAPPLEG